MTPYEWVPVLERNYLAELAAFGLLRRFGRALQRHMLEAMFGEQTLYAVLHSRPHAIRISTMDL